MSLSKLEVSALEIQAEKVMVMNENLSAYRNKLSKRIVSHGLDASAKRTLKSIGNLEAMIEAELDK